MPKKRYRLYPREAEFLGLEVKPNDKKRSQARYFITESDYQKVLDYRDEYNELNKSCKGAGLDVNDVSHFWYKGKHISAFLKKNNGVSYEEIRDDIIKEMSSYAPKYPKIKREKSNQGHLLVIDPADVHIGKLASSFESGDEYNSSIAVKRVKEGVQGILNKSYGFDIDKILLVIGNDILHTDTPKNTTTSGTNQDTHVMWYDAFNIAKRLYIEIIEMLVVCADVDIVYNPSNHDYMSGFFLSDTIKSWFRRNENVTFQSDMSHRKYYEYNNNIIGTSHGDGAKMDDLPLLMAQECGVWDKCKHRYWYIHHLHHKRSRDYVGVTVEVLRSPSGTDSWHHRQGYEHAPKAIEGFIHCKKHGQIARLTHIF